MVFASHDSIPLVLTRAEVCAWLHISNATLYRKIRDGKLPRPFLESPQRWRRVDIERFLEELRPVAAALINRNVFFHFMKRA